MTKRLIIMRGAPGSGKSTLAKIIEDGLSPRGLYDQETMNRITPTVLEADQFFTDSKGDYHFIPKLIPTAHEWCRRKCRKAMEGNVETIIIANTNTESWQFEPYIALAAEFGYQIQYIILHSPGQKNVHGVPDSKVKEMEDRLRHSLATEGM